MCVFVCVHVCMPLYKSNDRLINNTSVGQIQLLSDATFFAGDGAEDHSWNTDSLGYGFASRY